MMSDDTITIEVDGKSVEARPGQMLIEVTDAMGTYVPRFCYHKKLSVAANCRMCLVEVEKAPKPLPACATPVMDGMKVSTRSDYARDAQKSVMEFLLINHPLDCPICDQGGECELQDLAMGYGNDVSRYQETKRVVKDKNIGPLVQTEMTRCIHCTRCVRFGEEIAGMRELGATGRGEFMEIGTYVEKAMTSEMSGNVIDVCPVGALTSKPFRFSARTWEMKQLSGLAMHDAVGSNLHFHIRRDVLKRVVPAENEAINEVWLSDRDRFSYEALYSEQRLKTPLIKNGGEWQEVDWDTALQKTAELLKQQIASGGAEKIAAMASANSTSEELYLLQQVMHDLGSNNIDHRLGQRDFSEEQPGVPSLGMPIAELENLDAVLIVGGNVRKDQPILNHRLRKAALKGASIMQLNSVAYEFNYDLSDELILSPAKLVNGLAAIVKAAGSEDESLEKILSGVSVEPRHEAIAERLKNADAACVLLGILAETHPQFTLLKGLADALSVATGATLSFTGSAANCVGASLVGALPDRDASGNALSSPGLNAMDMVNEALPCYIVYANEPELDHCEPQLALSSLAQAERVIVFSAWDNSHAREYADVILPLAIYAENEGSFTNIEGQHQQFDIAVDAHGEARPGWKLLRVLANKLGLQGYQYENIAEVRAEMEEKVPATAGERPATRINVQSLPGESGLRRISDFPMNSADAFVRQAQSLQQTAEVADGKVHINSRLADSLGLADADKVIAQQGDASMALPLAIDERVADDCVLIQAKSQATSSLGAWYGDISLGRG